MAEAGTGAGAGVQVSKTVLKIPCKLFLVYLETSVAAASLGGPAGYLDNSDSEDKEEPGRATKRQSQREQPRPCTEVILALIFF